MLKKLTLLTLVASFSCAAMASKDVNYVVTLQAQTVFCANLSDYRKMQASAKKQDQSAWAQLINSEKCYVSESPQNVIVYIEANEVIGFTALNGQSYFTHPNFAQKQ